MLASAKLYRFEPCSTASRSRSPGIGAVFTAPAARGRGAARELIDRLLERAAADGADLALLFSEIGPDYYARLGFEAIATTDRQLRVTESTRYGAPMTMVRGGDDRDLADIVAHGPDAGRALPLSPEPRSRPGALRDRKEAPARRSRRARRRVRHIS